MFDEVPFSIYEDNMITNNIYMGHIFLEITYLSK